MRVDSGRCCSATRGLGGRLLFIVIMVALTIEKGIDGGRGGSQGK